MGAGSNVRLHHRGHATGGRGHEREGEVDRVEVKRYAQSGSRAHARLGIQGVGEGKRRAAGADFFTWYIFTWPNFHKGTYSLVTRGRESTQDQRGSQE